MNETRIQVRVAAGEETGEVRLAVVGDIDLNADDALSRGYAQAAERDAQSIILDFHEVGYINSTGIAVIVRLLAEARRDRREVRAIGLSEHYREIFRITRLADYLTIADEAPSPENTVEAST